MFESIKQNLKKEYQKFNISEEIIDNAINYAKSSNASSINDTIIESKKYIGSYLIKRCADDIDLEILLLDKYRQITFPILHKFSNILNMDEINRIYEQALEECFNDYNEQESISKNISSHMVKIINSEYKLDDDKTVKTEPDIKKNVIDDKKVYNIRFLEPYLANNGITIKAFSDFTGINSSDAFNYIKLGKDVRKTDAIKISLKFGCSIEELKKDTNLNKKLKELFKPSTESSVVKEEKQKKNIDISFLKVSKEERIQLIRALGANKDSFDYWISGYKKMPYYYLEKLLKYYGVSSLKELQKKFKDNIDEPVKEENSRIIENNIFEGSSFVNINTLNTLLETFNISEKYYNTVQILFSEDCKGYSLDELKRVTHLEMVEILRIYSECLKIYNDAFSKEYNRVMQYLNDHKEKQYN